MKNEMPGPILELWTRELLRTAEHPKVGLLATIRAQPHARLTRRQRLILFVRTTAGRVRDAYLVLIGKREVI